jgi:hypothetical protein
MRSLFRYLALVQQASLILAQNACVLTVPPNPLSATGLATPYQQSGCDQRQFADQASFVEAGIWDPATNSFSLYHPLVVNQGDVAGKNFIAPVAPVLPANATVALWFGTNGGSLTLTGTGAQQAGCVNGLNQNGAVNIFGQVCTMVWHLRSVICEVPQWRRSISTLLYLVLRQNTFLQRL